MHLPPSDIPVLRELLSWGTENFPQGNLSVSAQEIARRTGLHRNTVQRRMDALQKGGVVDGWIYEPHPHAVDLVRSGHLFEGVEVPDVAEFARRLAPFPGVSIAALHLHSCFLHTWHDGPGSVEEDVEELRDALGAQQVHRSFRSDHWPKSDAADLRLAALDRQILIALRRGSGRAVSSIAKRLGATRRTVARHVERLVSVKAGAMLPMFRPSRIQGKVVALFEVPEGEEVSFQVLREAFPERIMGPMATGRVMVMVPLEGLDEAARRQAEVKEKTGVRDLELRFMRDCWYPEACDDWLAKRVQNAPSGVANG